MLQDGSANLTVKDPAYSSAVGLGANSIFRHLSYLSRALGLLPVKSR